MLIATTGFCNRHLPLALLFDEAGIGRTGIKASDSAVPDAKAGGSFRESKGAGGKETAIGARLPVEGFRSPPNLLVSSVS